MFNTTDQERFGVTPVAVGWLRHLHCSDSVVGRHSCLCSALGSRWLLFFRHSIRLITEPDNYSILQMLSACSLPFPFFLTFFLSSFTCVGDVCYAVIVLLLLWVFGLFCFFLCE